MRGAGQREDCTCRDDKRACGVQTNATLKAKVEILRTNLSEAREEAERATVLEKQVALLKERLQEQAAAADAAGQIATPTKTHSQVNTDCLRQNMSEQVAPGQL